MLTYASDMYDMSTNASAMLFAKRGCVDCEKYWPQDWALRNTKWQVLILGESRLYLDTLNTDF